MADDPEHHAGNPQLQAQPDGGGQRAVRNGDRSRRTAHEERFGQRAMHGHLETRKIVGRAHTTAPPENEERQEEARSREGDGQAEHNLDQLAKAARRVAEGSARPVAMMMMTATMRATGP